MNRITRKYLRRKWGRLALVFWLSLFVFQLNLPLCASCFTGEFSSISTVQTSTKEMGCHGAVPTKACCSDDTETAPQPSSDSTDTCPMCDLNLAGCTSVSQERIALTSSAPVSAKHVLLVSKSPAPLAEFLNLPSRPFLKPQKLRPRSNPIFIFNSTFLI